MLLKQENTRETFEKIRKDPQEINPMAENINSSVEIPNKNLQEEPVKLCLVASHFHCEENKYHVKMNPRGRINFVTALNAEIPKVFHKHISEVIEYENLCYQRLGGKEQINEIAYANTIFGLNETLTFHSLGSVIDAFFHFFKKISVENSMEFQDNIFPDKEKNLLDFLMPIYDHSRALLCEQSQSNAHLVFHPKSENYILDYFSNLEQLFDKEQAENNHLIIVIKEKSDLDFLKFPKCYEKQVSFCYEIKLKKGVEFSVAHTKHESLYASLFEQNWFVPVSSYIQVAAIKNLELQTESNFDKTLKQMFLNEEVPQEIPSGNIYFAPGATNILETLAKINLNEGDRIAIEAPYYFNFEGDFKRAGNPLEPLYYKDSVPLQLKAKRAYEDGAKCFLVNNPRNPTGYVYSEEEIKSLCEWASELKDFCVIFDELYANSCYCTKKRFFSAISMALKHDNIFVVRGFAKDFGLSGFKLGMCISRSEKVKQKFEYWRAILKPKDAVFAVFDFILQKTNYGKTIFEANKTILSQAMGLAIKCLDEIGLPYITPEGGVFIMVDFRNFLEKNPRENEYTIWHSMLYDYGVAIGTGKLFKFIGEGWFRVCPIYDEFTIKEGFRRIGLFVNRKKLSF